MCKQNQQLALCSPKLLKMPAGLHTSRRCLTALRGFYRWLWQEETWKVFLTSLLDTHTRQEKEFQGTPGVCLSAKFSFICC